MARKPRQPAAYVTCQHCGRKFRAITVFHLRKIHGYEDDHPVLEYKSEFNLSFAMSPNSRKKISEAKEDFWEERGQHWTPEDVVTEIQRIHRAGGCLRRNNVPVSLYEVGRRLFGTWRAAVEKAGLQYEEVSGVRRWNRRKVITRIQQLAADGFPLQATHIKQVYSHLHRAGVKLFPNSWRKALRAAGFDPDEHKMTRCRWDRQSAEDWVRKQAAKGKSLLARNVPPDLLRFVYKRIRKGWADFVESLGIPYTGVKKRRGWTKRLLLSEIRRWEAEGHRMNYRAVADEYQALIHQARKYYRSWKRARAAARVRRDRGRVRETQSFGD
jgi:hypothetical protein